MMSPEEMTKRVEELVQEGMSMAEALQKVIGENTPAPAAPSTRIQMTADGRVSWISSLSNIADLKKAVKIAFAKKSKSKDKPASVARYEDEIKAGQARLNELIALINTAEDPIAKAIELGDEESGIVQRILGVFEAGLDDKLSKIQAAKKLTNKQIKDEVNSTSDAVPVSIVVKLGELGPKYLEIYEGRGKRGDQRIITLNKRLNYLAIEDVKARGIVTPAPEKVTEEPPVDESNEPTEADLLDTGVGQEINQIKEQEETAPATEEKKSKKNRNNR